MELYYLSATEALSKFKNKTLPPVELIKTIIDRSEKVNSKINAHNSTFRRYIYCNKRWGRYSKKTYTNGSIILKDHIASKTMSVPSDLSSSNVPTGIQIIARSYSDELVFQDGYNYKMLDPLLNSNENRP